MSGYKIKQIMGPKAAGTILTIPSSDDKIYIKIGINKPFNIPIEYISETGLSADLEINQQIYHINESDVLEFDDIKQLSLTITFLKDFPFEGVINIAYIEDN